MYPDEGKNDLFQVRLKPGVDFEEAYGQFENDAHHYLKSHSEDYRRLFDEHRQVRETLAFGLERADRLTNAFCEVADCVVQWLWAAGMTAAVRAAAEPDFDVAAYLEKQAKDCETKEYRAAAEELNRIYVALAEDFPHKQALLEQDREIRGRLIRYQIAAGAAYGFEWAADAQTRMGIELPKSAVEAFYRCVSEMLHQ